MLEFSASRLLLPQSVAILFIAGANDMRALCQEDSLLQLSILTKGLL